MRTRIPKILRKQVAKRANYRCEYCLLSEADAFFPFEVDHIVSLKHGGGNEFDNLSYSCPHCNQYKRTDLVTFLESYDDIIRLFNPRKLSWEDHFTVENGAIMGKTKIGKGTIKVLKFNDPDRVMLRQLLMQFGRYP